MLNQKKSEKTLFLCTTPLQLVICLKIIELKKISIFDVLYYTNKTSATARSYFEKISLESENNIFLHIKNNKELLISFFFTQKPFTKKNNYKNIYLASIDNLLFKKILKINPKSDIYTFDDGTANIFKDSEYFKPESIKKLIFFLKFFNLPNKKNIIKKTNLHYTIFDKFENIVPQEKTKFISIFQHKNKYYNKNNISFFIGQPFHEYLEKNQLSILKKYLKEVKIDYYVLHPRETAPLLENINILDKENEIAEIAIIKKSEKNKPLIISAFSTVLFNIDKAVADKIYLSISESEEESKRIKLIKKTGCKIIKLI